MRIISQNGMQDIPYDRKCISVTTDGCIVAHDNVCATTEQIRQSVIAEYSSKEIALEVMDGLRNLYTLGSKTVRLPREEELQCLHTI